MGLFGRRAASREEFGELSRLAVEEVTVGELMSRNGATFTYRDPADRKKKTVTAYYTSYYK